MTSTSPAASLADPFYYLANFHFVLGFVSERHADLLSAGERAFIDTLGALPQPAQALLVRMVMRKGEVFRTSKLVYPEIGDTADALGPLVEAGLVDHDPALSLDELFHVLRLPELRRALASEIKSDGLARAGKAALLEALAERFPSPRRLADWWPEAPGELGGERLLRLRVMETCDRLRLMFFGNLRQDWAEFVLSELGVMRFERVDFSDDSRAFQHRDEVDGYLRMHRLRERLAAGEAVAELAAELPEVPAENAWLATRRHRLCLALAQAAQREGDTRRAIELYSLAGWGRAKATHALHGVPPVATGNSEARIRLLRLLERLGRYREAHRLALSLAHHERLEDEPQRQALDRLLPRLARRLGLPVSPVADAPMTQRIDLTLDGPAHCVERAVRDHLQCTQASVHYVENTLITGLFGLLCWEALFVPLPGAFFHPFHSGPADLYREDFVARRRTRFEACLARLDDGSHGQVIRRAWRLKQGIANPFVHWGVLDEALLELALDCLPPAHLKACFQRLLGDLKANRAGLPDLIQFFPEALPGEPRYRMIEVKGPGDRLQDNQRRWLAFFHAQGMPVAVCHVRWQTTRAEPAE
ncbi:VRR-NUC domain-containing protein [Halomonas urumqiensis]|uniref:phosphodiesterase I n=1 Tax=Halomonas urumqiensis TaxID=1684789 RepID=A0A2N7UJ89_9GAMM|nr:VRR-NUC domain-containing protein [Halomonas urumqiensis]PMR80508.1 nuclease [Halomonas urumqiensis]PTB01647.1 VRR-NUC domain-containing protein [Halomonas urumqiensis]GHE22267.1 Fanconi-associated nuclease [Halomonas urumqiensis]